MAKRIIGIDICSSHIHAVQMARVGERFRMEKTFSAPLRRESDSPEDTLGQLFSKHGFDKRAGAAVCADHHDVFYRNIKTKTAGAGRDKTGFISDLKDEFPLPASEILTASCSGNNGPGNGRLNTAIERQSLRRRLDLLRTARMRCELVDAPVFAVYAALAINHPEIAASPAIILYRDSSHTILAVTGENEIHTVRGIPNPPACDEDDGSGSSMPAADIIREVEITWRWAYGEKVPENTLVVLAGTLGKNTDLLTELPEALACSVMVADLSGRVVAPALAEVPGELGIAQGLALRALTPTKSLGVNFIRTERDGSDAKNNSKKQMLVSIILISTLALLSVSNLFLRSIRQENEYANLKHQIRDTFRQTLPNEHNIVDESAQMEARLQELRREYASLEPLAGEPLAALDVLHAIFTHTPKNLNVNLDNILINGSTVRLTGLCGSFETPYKWEKNMRKVQGFASIGIEVHDRDPVSRLVKFTAEISLVAEK